MKRKSILISLKRLVNKITKVNNMKIDIIVNIPSIFIYKIYFKRTLKVKIKVFNAITYKCTNSVFIIKNCYKYIIWSNKGKELLYIS